MGTSYWLPGMALPAGHPWTHIRPIRAVAVGSHQDISRNTQIIYSYWS